MRRRFRRWVSFHRERITLGLWFLVMLITGAGMFYGAVLEQRDHITHQDEWAKEGGH